MNLNVEKQIPAFPELVATFENIERKPAHSIFMSAIQDCSIPQYVTRNRSRLRQRESCEVRSWEKYAEGDFRRSRCHIARHKLLERIGR
jgi:hypothetical protein